MIESLDVKKLVELRDAAKAFVDELNAILETMKPAEVKTEDIRFVDPPERIFRPFKSGGDGGWCLANAPDVAQIVNALSKGDAPPNIETNAWRYKLSQGETASFLHRYPKKKRT